jgi:hypothetical protein
MHRCEFRTDNRPVSSDNLGGNEQVAIRIRRTASQPWKSGSLRLAQCSIDGVSQTKPIDYC